MAVGFEKKGRSLIEDVTRGKYHPVVNLRQVDYRVKFGVLVGLLLLFAIVGISLFSAGRAQEAVFYPSACLGDWTNASLATGEPQTLSEDFSYNNSAVYTGGNSDIYCGGFSGSIPADVSLLAVKLKIYWQQKGPSFDLQPNFPVKISDQPTEEERDGEINNLEQEGTVDLENRKTDSLDVESGDSAQSATTNPQELEDNGIKSAPSVDIEQEEDKDKINTGESIDAEGGEEATSPLSLLERFFIRPILAQTSTSSAVQQTEVAGEENMQPDDPIEQQTDDKDQMDSDNSEKAGEEVIASDNFTSTFIASGESEGEVTANKNLIFVIKYSVDGVSWQKLAEVSKVEEVSELELPLLSVRDISNLQISIEGMAGDSSTLVLLDALELKVDFTELKHHKENNLKGSADINILSDRILSNNNLSVRLPDKEGSFEITDLDSNIILQQRLIKSAPVSPQVADGQALYSSIKPGVDLMVEMDEKGLKQQWKWKEKNSQSAIISAFFINGKPAGIYTENGVVAVIYDRNSGEDLFILSPPQAVDRNSKSIMLQYDVGAEPGELRLELPKQKLGEIEFPLRVDYAIEPKKYDEVLVKIGQAGDDVANAKDGDIVDIKPQGWPWGRMERRDYVIVRIKSLKRVEREKYLKANRDPSGALRYAVDYTKIATRRQLEVIRDYQQENPVLDATHLLLSNIIQKKNNLSASIIPRQRRLARSLIDKNERWWQKLAQRLIRRARAQTINTFTIGTNGRDYSTIQAWETAREGNLVTRNSVEKGEIYNDSVFTAGVIIDGSTTDSTHYMWLTVAAADRHNGTAGSGARLDADSLAATAVIDVADPYTIVEWLEVYDSTPSATQSRYGIRAQAGYGTYRNLIIHDIGDGAGGTDNSAGWTGWTSIGTAETSYIYNNLFYNINGQGIQLVMSADVFNNTLYSNAGYGIMCYAGYCDNSGVAINITNNLSVGNNTGTGGAADFETADLDANDYMNNNISSDGTADDCSTCLQSLDNIVSQSADNQFTSTSTPNLHLKAGSTAINAGTSTPSSAFTDDIDSDSRPVDTKWDVGADESPYYTEILRPNAAGSYTNLSVSGCTNNWECVDEAVSDGDTTYVYEPTSVLSTDLYNLADSTGSGTINGVKVHINCLGSAALDAGNTIILTNSSTYTGSSNLIYAATYTEYTTFYGTNPNTNSAWTWTEVDALEAGAQLRSGASGNARCTQVWATVYYTPVTNSAPSITSVSDSPDPVKAGNIITFSVDWNDADAGEQVKVHICKTDSLTNGSCDGGSWCDSASFTTDDPASCTYTTQTSDIGTQNYYAFVCDDGGACSSSTSTTFTVKSWWNDSWGFRYPIVIDNTNNSNTLTEYQIYVQVTSTLSNFWSNVNSDGSDVRFVGNDDATLLDHWQQYWDYSGQDAKFWVQVDSIPANSTTTIYIYYGNSLATSVSDPAAPFTYSTMQDLMYVVRNDIGTNPVAIISLIDNNTVQVDNQTSVNLNRQQITTFTSLSATSVIRAKGPIHAKFTGGSNFDAAVPISFAGTQFAIGSTRSTENFHIYSPFRSASVSVYNGTTLVATSTVSTSTASTLSNNNTSLSIVESDYPILLSFDNSGPYDGFVPYPTTNEDFYGIRSQYNYIGIATNSTTFSLGCSSGSGVDVSAQNRGTNYSNATCANGSEGTGNAVRVYNISNPVGAIQQADSDGGETTTFLPLRELGTEYMVPTNAAYITVACPPEVGTVNLSIYDETNNLVTSGSCSGSGNNPGKAYFGTGDTATYNAGSRIVSTNNPPKPFYVYYEDVSVSGGGDENNLWSWPQSRKYSYPHPSYSFGSSDTSPTLTYYTQNYYRWYVNTDGLTPSDPWPSGASDLAENEAISTSTVTVASGTVLRLRLSLQVSNLDAATSSEAFKLQYGEGSDCASISSWTDVGSATSSAIWRGYNNATPSDGATLPSTLLSVSDVAESYEEENISTTTPRSIAIGQDGEWDWVIQNNGAALNTKYCFRLVKSGGALLAGYNNYPQLITNASPTAPTILSPFNNAKVDSTLPTFRFTSSDVNGDDLTYQIEWSTDYNFSSAITKTSDTDAGFSNVDTPADTDPFNSGDTVSFTIQSGDDLTNGTTYWWRIRVKDPNGSGQWSSWSGPYSFTVDTSVTVSTWFQTTDEQFLTDQLDGVIISGNDSLVMLSEIGEFGTVTLTDNNWTTVSLNKRFNNLIVVASPRYAPSTDAARAVRIRNKSSTSFEVKVDNYTSTFSGTTKVDWLAMEAGAWNLANGTGGTKVIAGTVNTNGTFCNTDNVTGSPQTVSFNPNFNSSPAVITTVTSDNDSAWTVTHVDDGSVLDYEPTVSTMRVMLNVSFESCTDPHGAEDIDYIAFDTGHGTNNSNEFDAVVGADTTSCCSSSGYATNFTSAFASAPQVTVIAQMGEDGGNGGYAVTHTGTQTSTTTHYGSIDEDGSGADRSHTNETVAIFAFSSATGTLVRYFSGSETGTVTSTPINFSDGNSNRWGELFWTDDETNGDIKYHLYYNNNGSWQLIPDTDLSGNSTGFDVSPVDISSLATSTYSQLKIVANFTYSGGSPELYDWGISWSGGGTLSVDIVDSGGSSVASPKVDMSTATLAFSCQSVSGTFGTTTERIRVTNTTSNPQWTLTVAASSTTALWQNASSTLFYDFNDGSGSPAGCGDGSDADTYAGQMTINPSVATITPQNGCTATGITLGSQASFVEGATDNITIATAGSSAATSCYWDFTGIDVSQQVPAEQVNDVYSIDLILTITAV